MAERSEGGGEEDLMCGSLERLVESGKVRDPSSLATRLTKLAASCRSLAKKANASTTEVVGKELLIVPEVSSVLPRGKVSVLIGEDGMALRTKSEEVLASFGWSKVVEVLAAPSSDTQSVESQSSPAYLIVVIDQKYKKDKFMCVTLSVKKKEDKVSIDEHFFAKVGVNSPKNELSTSAALGLAISKLSQKPLRRLVRGNDSFFLSSVTGAPFVKATLGTSAGHLALTRSGLLFLKPPVFLPTRAISSIETGRAGGVSHSSVSFFDLVAEISDEEAERQYEFSNIAKDELGRVQQFVTQVISRERGRSAEEEVVVVKREKGVEESEDEDEEDDDFDPDADDDDEEEDDDDEAEDIQQQGDDSSSSSSSEGDDDDTESEEEPAIKKLRSD